MADPLVPEPLPRFDLPPDRLEALRERLDRWRDDPRAGAVVLAVVALGAGLLWYRSAAGAGPTDPGPAVTAVAAATSTTDAAPEAVVVHVSGAVAAPGVYRLPPGSRADDAVRLAGGALEGAQLDRLNLAAKLVDGQRVHVPREGEAVPPEVGAAGGTSDPATASGPLNLNLATAADLEALPGVGPAIARAIVEERDRRGGFRSVDDLLAVRGIGESRLEDIRPLVTV